MKLWKKVLSILLVVILLAGQIAAIAVPDAEPEPSQDVISVTEEVDFSEEHEDGIPIEIYSGKKTNKFGPHDAQSAPQRAVNPFEERERDTTSEFSGADYDTDTLIVKLRAKPSNDGFSLMSAEDGIELTGVSQLEPVLDLTTTDAKAVLNTTENTGWFKATLQPGQSAQELLSVLAESSDVLEVEYNYIHRTTGAPDISGNTSADEQWYLDSANVQKAWEYLDTEGLAGGSGDVIVAVIDTGVDYNHEDLRDSMWVNPSETANGYDDDGNDFADDIHGVSTVGNIYAGYSGNPMDDNGHGTHVAGIIAAANNNTGIAGVAYNTKIMAIKAGNASGYFTNDSIVAAINYAVANGADVINMSFGSYSRSQLVENALQLAYQHCVLIAAAGNDGIQNLPGMLARDFYPAAYPWVVGVMSMDEKPDPFGFYLSSFSNWDTRAEDSHEYQVMAPGSAIISTLPGNNYGKWSGTSMAAPVVSGVAALLRAKYSDKDLYSSRFIMGQIAATGDKKPGTPYSLDYLGYPDPTYYTVDAYKALTTSPQPRLTYLEHYVFDLESISDSNDENGVVDAGEIVDLGVVIRNQWGAAKDVTVTLETNDPYVTWHKKTVDYGEVGSFATADNGLVRDAEGAVNNIGNGLRFAVASNTPNDYIIEFKIVIKCKNGGIGNEATEYVFDEQSLVVVVRNGKTLPVRIASDMTLTEDTYWIIAAPTLIEEGVTVTVEPGTQIQFWSSQPQDPYATLKVPILYVDGKFISQGTVEKPVELFASPTYDSLKVDIKVRSRGEAHLSYTKVMNPYINVTTIDHCYFTQANFNYIASLYEDQNGNRYETYYSPQVHAKTISNSIFSQLGTSGNGTLSINGIRKGNLFDSCLLNFSAGEDEGNVFLKNNKLFESQYGDRQIWGSVFYPEFAFNLRNWLAPKYAVKNPDNGSIYFAVSLYEIEYSVISDFAKSLGGHIITISDDAEFNFITDYIREHFYNKHETIKEDYPDSHESYYYLVTGYNDYDDDGIYEWENGENSTYQFPLSPSGKGNFMGIYSGGYVTELTRDSLSRYDTYTIIEIPGEPELRELRFAEESITVGDDDGAIRLDLEYIPAKPASLQLTWTSSDESVATVENGVLTPVKAGSTVITAESKDGIKAACNVIVSQSVPVTGVSLNTTNKTLSVGATYKIQPVFTPTNATNKQINWQSSAPAVATVSEQGVVTAVSVGNAIITGTLAKNQSITVKLDIEVVKPITGISLHESFMVIGLGSTAALNATAIPADATNVVLEYTSSDETVATVSETGLITPVSPGNVIITVSSASNSEIAAGCVVSVVENMQDATPVSISSSNETVSIVNAKGEVYMHGRTTYYPEKFGLTGFKELAIPEKINGLDGVTKVVSNYYVCVALKSDGTVWAWGYDGWTYFGREGYEPRTIVPIQLDITDVRDIAVGNNCYIFLKKDGTVWSMGSGGQLGLGGTDYVKKPTKIGTLVNIKEIRRFDDTMLALDTSGVVYAWGYFNSQYNIYPTILTVPSSIASISFGTERRPVFMADDNSFYGFDAYSSEFTKITAVDDLASIAGDIRQILWNYEYSYMVLKNDGTLWIKGGNNNYSNIPKTNVNEFVKYTALENIEYISSTNDVTYFLSKDGGIYVYSGNPASYQLGTGDGATSTSEPKRVLFGVHPDGDKPILESSSPENNKEMVGIEESIVLTYSEAIKPSAAFSMVKLYTLGADGKTIPATIYTSGRDLVLVPKENLKYDTMYYVLVPQDSLGDIVGNATDSVEISFKTQSQQVMQSAGTFNLFGEENTTTDSLEFTTATEFEKMLREKRMEFIGNGFKGKFQNNAILNVWNSLKTEHWMNIYGTGAPHSTDNDHSSYISTIANNYWGTTSKKIIETAIVDTNDNFNFGGVFYEPILTEAPEICYPFVTNAYVMNANGEVVTNVGPEKIKVVVEFNRAMDVSKPLAVTFGTDVPYGDFTINGTWADDKKWVGEYTVTALTGGGNQYLKITGGVAKDDTWLVTGNDSERFGFTIETTGAQSMNLFASAEDEGIALSWVQDDFDVLAGYNIYRTRDGEDEPIRINSHVIDKGQSEFTDTTVESGQRYSYYFKVVLSNGTESSTTSNVVTVTARDNVAPVISHSPISFAKLNTQVSVYANITDNVSVKEAALYYRTAGKTTYTKASMITVDDLRYSANIPSSAALQAGIEYYITATDISGNTESFGTDKAPIVITVVAQNAAQLGDVNGDEAINSTDALMVLRASVGLLTLKPEEASAADMNGDGDINAVDALLILQKATQS